MSKLELYRITPIVKELSSKQVELERKLQTLIEENMDTFFGVRFLYSEYTTSNGGRIDSLGLDENNLPVIFEYKRSINENVINQGLFYLDWLVDHKADIRELVRKKLGEKQVSQIDESSPRLICVAADFTKYDVHAVNQIDRNIDLIRYRVFADDLILFEQVYSKTSTPVKINGIKTRGHGSDKTFTDMKNTLRPELRELYEELADYTRTLGDDITEHEKKLYLAFKKIKNFVCIELRNKNIVLYLKLNPDDFDLEEGVTRDVRNIGHWGTGDLEVVVFNKVGLERAKTLIEESYRRN
ncbi:hypothetical protein SDC9_17429 [bioreactor metagenome]|uniref:DUF5655 domain-containing protein n=1 Tax=bioreactor metagenome TaxID=1076179 RepID=A0A644TZN0_9ZZZZ|nr:DUF5655 domain-containing protein [Methanocorpusculum sp.]